MPLFVDYHRTIVGYHGMRLDKALAVVSGHEELEPSRTGYDWLGHGIYFWEYGPKQAWQWARQRHPGEEIAVVAAMIRLGNCLDLVDPDNTRMLRGLYDRMMTEMKVTKRRVLHNVRSRKYLDCQVMEYVYNTLKESGEYVDSARAVYVPSGSEKQKRIWPSSWMSYDTHLQVCIRNTANIVGCWLVKPTKGMEI